MTQIPHPPVAESKRVIVVEDDLDFRDSIVQYLVLAGFDVTGVASALEFYQCIAREHYSLVILDIGLPDQNGLVLAEYVRHNTEMRIIMLTAQTSQESKVTAYNAGADIYLVKPVDFSELLATLYSILGRLDNRLLVPQAVKKTEPVVQEEERPWRVVKSEWTLLSPEGEEIRLTSKEFYLIEKLASLPNGVVQRLDLLQSLDYNNNAYGNRSLDALVHRLRGKQKEGEFKIPLKTVHGAGYCFSAPIIMV